MKYGIETVQKRRGMSLASGFLIDGFEMLRTDHMEYEMNLVNAKYPQDKIVIFDFDERMTGGKRLNLFQENIDKEIWTALGTENRVYIDCEKPSHSTSDEKLSGLIKFVFKTVSDFLFAKNSVRDIAAEGSVKAWAYLVGIHNEVKTAKNEKATLSPRSLAIPATTRSNMIMNLMSATTDLGIILTVDIPKSDEWDLNMFRNCGVVYLPNVRTTQSKVMLSMFYVNKEEKEHCLILGLEQHELTGYETHY